MDSANRFSTPEPRASLTLVPSAAAVFSIVDQAVVVALRGDLTAACVPMVRAHLLTLVDDGGPDQIIIDLSRVSSIDEAGARPLLEAHRVQSRRHGCLRLGTISAVVADFLETHSVFAETLGPFPEACCSRSLSLFSDAARSSAGVSVGPDEDSGA